MENSNKYIAIMAGGVGSRFWPASRESLPKQFLDILGVGKSLIQLTYDRALQLVPKENILIATNKRYKELVNEHLPDISDNQILLEPSRNNTAPCIAYLALKIANQNPDSTFAVWPSDHVILKEMEFNKKMNLAFSYAEKGEALVTLGIQPTRPDTGYGYIEVNHKDGAQAIEKVVQFKEKPDLETAQSYLDAGNYFWNAGIFIWSVKAVTAAFQNNAPSILKVLGEDVSKYNTAEEQEYIDRVYPNTEKISVDYALLERSKNVYTIPADIGWSDLGTWNSLHAYLEKDKKENVMQGIILSAVDCEDNFVRLPRAKKAVIKGLKNMIVIDEGDVLLIYPKDQEQEIKSVRNDLNDDSVL
ncbi:MAG: mannose-1-phosphate guanylyltransferase [Saprospiraceae bacterium]